MVWEARTGAGDGIRTHGPNLGKVIPGPSPQPVSLRQSTLTRSQRCAILSNHPRYRILQPLPGLRPRVSPMLPRSPPSDPEKQNRNGLHSRFGPKHDDAAQRTSCGNRKKIGCNVLYRMTRLGMPASVRIIRYPEDRGKRLGLSIPATRRLSAATGLGSILHSEVLRDWLA
jgi:hypothetical protein